MISKKVSCDIFLLSDQEYFLLFSLWFAFISLGNELSGSVYGVCGKASVQGPETSNFSFGSATDQLNDFGQFPFFSGP
jgi:hypothetical protein